MIKINDSLLQIVESHFAIGNVVQHTKHHYRAVVIDVDGSYQDEQEKLDIMFGDMTPNLEQPWYTILIDGGEELTYMPESMLRSDSVMRPIEHPLVPTYLTSSDDGFYKPRLHIS